MNARAWKASGLYLLLGSVLAAATCLPAELGVEPPWIRRILEVVGGIVVVAGLAYSPTAPFRRGREWMRDIVGVGAGMFLSAMVGSVVIALLRSPPPAENALQQVLLASEPWLEDAISVALLAAACVATIVICARMEPDPRKSRPSSYDGEYVSRRSHSGTTKA